MRKTLGALGLAITATWSLPHWSSRRSVTGAAGPEPGADRSDRVVAAP